MKKRRRNVEIVVALLVVLFIISVGTIFYRLYEELSWIDSLYFTSMTVATVGFGDLAPTSQTSRLFTIIYALISIPAILFCLGLIIEGFLKRRIDNIEDEVVKVIEAEDEILRREEKIITEEKIIERSRDK